MINTFAHFNFNVFDLEKSIKFYDEAFGLKPVREKELGENFAKLVFLGDGETGFELELTYLYERTEPYNLGECEYHLAIRTDDYESLHAKHEEMGIIAFDNKEVGVYFVTDPDGYWIEVLPVR